MSTNIAVGRTVFVMGRRVDGNRQVMVVNDGEEYSVDISTAVVYTNQTARFPYTV